MPVDLAACRPELRKFINRVLGPGGSLARRLPGYEHRQDQLRLALAVGEGLVAGRHVVVEAGTGIGKSLAYLVPAAWFARRAETRVAVATHTINLQQQLLHKDIPLLREILPEGWEVRAALVKGRQNYLCRQKLDRLLQAELFETPEEAGTAQALVRWATAKAREGDREEAPPEFAALWPRVSSDGEDCLGFRCPQRGECFVRRARERQKEAGLLVVNHALLFADLAVRFEAERGVMEDYGALVLDEAHHLEDVASAAFGLRVSVHRVKSVADAARAVLRSRHPAAALLEEADRQRLLSLLQELQRAQEDFFRALKEWAGGNTRRLLPQDRDALEDVLSPPLDGLREALMRLAARPAATAEVEEELSALARRAERVGADLRAVLGQEGGSSYAYWAEADPPALAAAPVALAGQFREFLFDQLPSVAMVSATLGDGSDLSFFTGRLGLSPGGYLSLVLPSPFDFRQNCLLYLPADAPDPREPGYEDWAVSRLHELVAASRGRALLLFTSYGALERAYQALSPNLAAQGFTALRQDNSSREKLLAGFREAPAAVLFATSSFWEGVDVPGEALSLVVIHRLPFPVPDTPLLAARMEHLEEQGQNPFYQFSVPLCAVRLRQGFGRLLRTASDRGVVAILDAARLRRMGYGRLLLRALPPARQTTDLAEVAAFFQGPGKT